MLLNIDFDLEHFADNLMPERNQAVEWSESKKYTFLNQNQDKILKSQKSMDFL